MEQMFNVSSNPHVRARMTTAKIMQLVVIALLPAALMGIYNHGLKALAVLVVSTGSAALAEWLYDHFMHKKNTVKDFSAVVTGLLIGLNMPAGIPLWIPVLGSIFAIIVVKQLFGGLGQNFMNPALAARCFLMISFAGKMTDFSVSDSFKGAVDGVTGATPLAALRDHGFVAGSSVPVKNLIFGNIQGTIGETSVIAILIGAAILGPRIGKFKKQKDGSIKVGAFPGHNLALGALGVFILWLGWYGFNGAACTSVEQLGSVFLTTTVAPAVATVVCMIFTWIKYGKPDVSMCLNASLAGLVAITAPCDVTDCFGAIVIGAVAGLLVVFGVWLLDYKLHVDDPVGAVAVHCLNGIWGTIATGLFATTSAPGNDSIVGLFYGGGFKQLGLQLLGFVSVAAWTAVTITIAFLIIKATVGLRVSEEEEIVGLDSCEHGLPSAYAGFSIMDISNTMTMEVNENTSLGVSDYDAASATMKEAAVKVETAPAAIPATGIYKVVVIAKLARFEVLKKALNDLGVTGMTMTQVMGCGVQKGAGEMYRGVEMDATLLPKVKVEVVVSKIPVATVIEAAKKALYTGHIGDGKIFVYNVDKVVKVRTGEEDFAALQDVE